MDLTELVAHLHGSGVGRMVLLMRHGAREYDRENPEREPFLPLTERGRTEARAFGERLSVPSIHLESSPVGRCRETAQLVGEGAAAGGVATRDNVLRPHLGAFFIRDLNAVVRACIADGVQTVFASWARGDALRDELMAPDEAAQNLMAPLIECLDEPDAPAITTCVTHDANVYLARAHCFRTDADSLGPVRYLEGLVLFRDGAALHAACPGLDPRPIDAPS